MRSAKPVRAVSRALQVLEALTLAPPASLGDLHRATGLDRATLLRILRTLHDDGYVLRSMSTGRYAPAPRLAGLGRGLRHVTELTEAAAETLDRLCRDLVWPSDIGVPRDGAIEIVETSRTLSPFLMNPRVHGQPISMFHSAMGQAWLAFCDADEREAAIERMQARRIEGFAIERCQIDLLVAQVRARGYGVRTPGYTAFAGSLGDKLRALAVPVAIGGRAVAALNLVWVARFATEAEMADSHLPRLHAAAAEIAGRIAAQQRPPHEAARPA